MQYFRQGNGTITSDEIEALGLSYIYPKGKGFSQQQCFKGPDGQGGVLFWYGANQTYSKTDQTWIKRGDYWMGFDTENPPGPEFFDKGTGLAGIDFELSDGNKWRFSPSAALPQRYTFDADGEEVFKPIPKHSDHYEACRWLFDRLQTLGEGDEYTDTEFIERIAVVLATNYRITYNEILALGLFDTSNLFPAAFASIGVDLATLKKKEDTAE